MGVQKRELPDGSYVVENGRVENVTGLTRSQASLVVDLVKSEASAEVRDLQSRIKGALGIHNV